MGVYDSSIFLKHTHYTNELAICRKPSAKSTNVQAQQLQQTAVSTGVNESSSNEYSHSTENRLHRMCLLSLSINLGLGFARWDQNITHRIGSTKVSTRPATRRIAKAWNIKARCSNCTLPWDQRHSPFLAYIFPLPSTTLFLSCCDCQASWYRYRWWPNYSFLLFVLLFFKHVHLVWKRGKINEN